MSKPLIDLTPEIEKQIEEWRVKCLEIGYRCHQKDTEKEDYARTDEILGVFYSKCNLKVPKIVHARSPHHVMTLVAILKEAEKVGATVPIPEWFTDHTRIPDLFEHFGIKPANVKVEAISTRLLGSYDIYWMARYVFAEKFLDPHIFDGIDSVLPLWFDLAQISGHIYPFEEICFVSDRAMEIHVDEQGNMHNVHGPAVLYGDGYKYYAYRGLNFSGMPDDLLHPERMTIDRILHEKNQEIKQALVQLYGYEKFIKGTGAILVNEDMRGKLWKKEMPEGDVMMFVELVNSTPEPDGHHKVYFERVHPELRPMSLVNGEPVFGEPQELTCHNAVASQFGLYGHEYHPDFES